MAFPRNPLAMDDLLMAGVGFSITLVVVAAVSFFGHAKYAEAAAPQPIAFDHRLHVEDEGLECSVCHAHYREETFSGIPEETTCALCHSDPQGESPEEAKLVQALREGVPVEWKHLFRQPPHVFFSHRRHVVVAELECTTCHGDIGSSETPPLHPRRLKMEDCIACHEERSVPVDCSECHR